jgi:hypothetical protein
MKIIAYYLPQYHPIKENNDWWGRGFTEWTNVGKAKKYFRDHYQPKIPKDLGYYDLRIDDVRKQQADLAREAGVDGFCYWHYWFGNGRRLLEMPFNEVLRSGEPDFPFCLGWANESWKSKVWDFNSPEKDKMLMHQLYPGKEDIINHFYSVLEAFNDIRYIRKRNKPIFVVYKPFLVPEASELISIWNELAQKEGFDGVHFIGHTEKTSDIQAILSLGFEAVNVVRNGEYAFNKQLIRRIIFPVIMYKFFKKPLKIRYSLMIKYFVQSEDKASNVYPSIIPNWDHTPRSGHKGSIFHNSTPTLFAKHVRDVFNVVKDKDEDDKIIFIKSWNEWGEGNYMEPDHKFGKQYIEVLGAIRENEVGKETFFP